MPQSPSTLRVLRRCRQLAQGSSDERTWIGSLLLALIRDESLAAAVLNSLDLSTETLLSGALGQQVANLTREPALQSDRTDLSETSDESHVSLSDAGDPDCLSRVIDRANLLGRKDLQGDGLTSAHLLLAATQVSDVMQRLLKVKGYSESDILEALGMSEDQEVLAVPPDAELRFADAGVAPDASSFAHAATHSVNLQHPETSSLNRTRPRAADNSAAWRVVDANLNRAREGFRVLDDYSRFVLSDHDLTSKIKLLRHELVSAEQRLLDENASSAVALHQNRDTEADVGTGITVSGESSRDSMNSVLSANIRRVQEALRSLEEFGKLLSSRFAATMKQLRYESYSLEQRLVCSEPTAPEMRPGHDLLPDRTTEVLQDARLYLLLTESMCELPWQQVAEQSLDAGVRIVQLREKQLTDRELVRRSKWLASICREHGALCIVNDRPDIARAAGADGVHVGQDELTCQDAGGLLGDHGIVGVSTHAIRQAREAVDEGAAYIGVGPVFPSATKSFDDFPGLDYLRAVSQNVDIPWFAIGGITLANVDEVIAAGAGRVAVTSAISRSPSPGEVAGEFLNRLLQVPV